MKVSYRTNIRKPRDLHLRHSQNGVAYIDLEYNKLRIDFSGWGGAYGVAYDRPSDIREIAGWLYRAADYIEEKRNND